MTIPRSRPRRHGSARDRWPLYFRARAGVLGPVDAGVVAAACGFAVLAEGLSPLAAVLSAGGARNSRGERVASAVPDLGAVARRTDLLAGQPFAGLTDTTRAELVERLDAVFRTFRSPTSG